MVQGKVKHKVTMPDDIKKSSKNKTTKSKGSISKKQKQSNIQNILKNKLESSIKKNIENDLASRVKSNEGKSFRILK